MAGPIQPSYVPALRMKAGELAGLRDLAADVADRVLPRIIIPPIEERDQGLQGQLFKAENDPNIAEALAAHWQVRPVLVEATYLLPELGRESIGLWLPKMFERARRAGVPAIPLVALTDLTTDSRDAYRAACGTGPVRLGIIVSYADLGSHSALYLLLTQLQAMRLSPADCSIVVDFAGSDFSRPEIVAPVVGAALEMLQEAGLWRQVIFQGTNFPTKNPAEPGGSCAVPRNEWTAWCQAVCFDPATAEHMLFGDYAADCATMTFGEGARRPIPHYRYATSEAWLVQRGSASGAHATVMRDVCIRIVESSGFAGQFFSSADEYIFRAAQGQAGPGNPTTWRAINTTHHITQVVADIGRVRGFSLRQHASLRSLVQESLFTTPRRQP